MLPAKYKGFPHWRKLNLLINKNKLIKNNFLVKFGSVVIVSHLITSPVLKIEQKLPDFFLC